MTDRFGQLMNDRAAMVGWRAAALAPDGKRSEAAAAVETIERTWLDHLAAGGDAGLETARGMFPGPWFDLWRSCR